MPYQTVTVTSASTIYSAPVALNWIGGKPTTVSVTTPSSTASCYPVVQFTLDDIMRVSSSLVGWVGVSSNIGQPATIFTASAAWPDGVTISFLNPIAAVRLQSTTVSSGPVSMKVVQGEGW